MTTTTPPLCTPRAVLTAITCRPCRRSSCGCSGAGRHEAGTATFVVESDLDLTVAWHFDASDGLESDAITGTARAMFGGDLLLGFAVNDAIWTAIVGTPARPDPFPGLVTMARARPRPAGCYAPQCGRIGVSPSLSNRDGPPPRSRSWFGRTRRRCYVVGNPTVWDDAGAYGQLDRITSHADLTSHGDLARNGARCRRSEGISLAASPDGFPDGQAHGHSGSHPDHCKDRPAGRQRNVRCDGASRDAWPIHNVASRPELRGRGEGV